MGEAVVDEGVGPMVQIEDSQAGSESKAAVEILPWDSDFFGRSIARLQPGPMDDERARTAVKWCVEQGVSCAYYLCAGWDRASSLAARRAGFEAVDLRMELVGEAGTGPTDKRVRSAKEGDVENLEAIARGAHTDSRFYFDGTFPTSRCDDLYALWIRKSVSGWADAVLVIDQNERAEGYISCHLEGEGQGRIGLLAVSASSQGTGGGTALVRGALTWFHKRDVNRVSVVTQGRNWRALRLYQRCGFQPVGCDIWFHRWMGEEKP